MNGPMPAARCPGNEVLGAFIDGRVGSVERAEIERHLLDCHDCRELVVMASAHATAAAGDKPLSRWWLSIAAAAAVFAFAVWARPLWFGTDTSVTTAVTTLAEARPDRPVAGRLSGDRQWRAQGSPTRGGDTAIPVGARVAIAEIEEALERERTPATLSAFAFSRLFSGDISAAVAALEEAAALDEKSPGVWSDLAAAYLARADADRASDLTRALDAANRALALDQSRPESWFNKALILERQQQWSQAIEAWERYLSIENDSEWASEARTRLAQAKQAGP